MPDGGPILSTEEEAVLEVFKVRLISKGVGLTRDVLASELKWVPAAELDAALAGLIEKGLLSNPAFYPKIFLLTPEGKRHIDTSESPY
jgi:hypothetical protein